MPTMIFKHGTNEFRTLFIGAGPGGTGPIVCAQQQGRLQQLLDSRIAIVDKTNDMGRGTIGKYVINSDTIGSTFMECLINQEMGPFQKVFETPAKQSLENYRKSAAPLRVVGEFMGEIGTALQTTIDQHPLSQFFPCTEAHEIHQTPDGHYHTLLSATKTDGSRESFEIRSQYVVTALGARQHQDRTLNSAIIPGLKLAGKYAHKSLLTDFVLTASGVAEIERRLKSSTNKKVVIIGASHSTFSAAWVLLNKVGLAFDEEDITILHRQKLKVFYPSVEDALADGYTDFDENDVCPLTKRLYRLGGLRFDSRELLMRIRGIGNRMPEKRVRLVPLDPTNQHNPIDIETLLEEAALIIPAFGYRPNTIPLYDQNGSVVELLSSGDGAPPLVDSECRVLDADGHPIVNYFGIGLATGYKLGGALGGEPSFDGQTNGLWLYQNGVGERILNQII